MINKPGNELEGDGQGVIPDIRYSIFDMRYAMWDFSLRLLDVDEINEFNPIRVFKAPLIG